MTLTKTVMPDLVDPGLAVWPEKEKGQAKKLKSLLSSKGVDIYIVEDGVHGSSTLVDERTKADMSGARAHLADWLSNHISAAGE